MRVLGWAAVAGAATRMVCASMVTAEALKAALALQARGASVTRAQHAHFAQLATAVAGVRRINGVCHEPTRTLMVPHRSGSSPKMLSCVTSLAHTC